MEGGQGGGVGTWKLKGGLYMKEENRVQDVGLPSWWEPRE